MFLLIYEDNPTTIKYRKYLVQNEIKKSQKKNNHNLNNKIENLKNELNQHQINVGMKSLVGDALIEHLKHKESIIKNKIVKKLNNLYNGKILLKTDSDAYINLSDYTLKKMIKNYSI